MLRPLNSRSALVVSICLLPLVGLAATSLSAQTIRHPMDPLTHAEHWTVIDVIRAAGHTGDSVGYTLVTLHEPPKSEVLAWNSGDPIRRAAFAILKQGTHTYEVVVDLHEKKIESWEEIEGVQPTWLNGEYQKAAAIAMKNDEWKAAMAKRGITDFSDLDCFGSPLGSFGRPEYRGKRIATVACTDLHGARTYAWSRFISGLTVMVDVDAGEVLDVIDEGVVPFPELDYRYDDEAIGPKREVRGTISMEQPLGVGFELDGHLVRWQNWTFHHRVDPRVGPIISNVTFNDGGRDRSVLYQGHISEIFVPYMDPTTPWYAFNFLDAGEYSAGGLAKPMLPGLDCPANAVFFDALVAGDNGKPTTTRNALCIFERYAGDVAWRHYDESDGSIESRPKRDLVVRTIAVLGNYDYLFDWVFQQDGSITVRTAATGISNVKAVAQELVATVEDAAMNDGDELVAERADAYGRFVAPNLVAVNHDHFFSYRLDLDVDGPVNSMEIDQLKQTRLPDNHPRKSIWTVSPTIAQREADGMRRIDFARPAVWRVINPNIRNAVGYPASYQLKPGGNLLSLLAPDDYPQLRAGFVNHHLWVTPYNPQERYAAGTYPTLSEPGKGLPEWTGANRAVAETDIVVWYTFGMHHVVRAEDFPVMPMTSLMFELRPFDFFNRNPAMDLPRKP